MKKLSDQITVRLPQEMRTAIQEIETRHRIGAAEFVRGLVEAAVKTYRHQGFFGFPVEVVPDRRLGRS
jgi:hypothetical protein